jgi:hypothetical protein
MFQAAAMMQVSDFFGKDWRRGASFGIWQQFRGTECKREVCRLTNLPGANCKVVAKVGMSIDLSFCLNW